MLCNPNYLCDSVSKRSARERETGRRLRGRRRAIFHLPSCRPAESPSSQRNDPNWFYQHHRWLIVPIKWISHTDCIHRLYFSKQSFFVLLLPTLDRSAMPSWRKLSKWAWPAKSPAKQWKRAKAVTPPPLPSSQSTASPTTCRRGLGRHALLPSRTGSCRYNARPIQSSINQPTFVSAAQGCLIWWLISLWRCIMCIISKEALLFVSLNTLEDHVLHQWYAIWQAAKT